MEQKTMNFLQEARGILENYQDHPKIQERLKNNLDVIQEYIENNPVRPKDEQQHDRAEQALFEMFEIEHMTVSGEQHGVLSEMMQAAFSRHQHVIQQKNEYLNVMKNMPEPVWDTPKKDEADEKLFNQAYDDGKMKDVMAIAQIAARHSVEYDSVKKMIVLRDHVKDEKNDPTAICRDSDKHLHNAKVMLVGRELSKETTQLIGCVEMVESFSYKHSFTTKEEVNRALAMTEKIETEKGKDPDAGITGQLRLTCMALTYERAEKDWMSIRDTYKNIDRTDLREQKPHPQAFVEAGYDRLKSLSNMMNAGNLMEGGLIMAKLEALRQGPEKTTRDECRAIGVAERFYTQYPRYTDKPQYVKKAIENCGPDSKIGAHWLGHAFKTQYRDELMDDQSRPNAIVEPEFGLSVEDNLDGYASHLQRYDVPCMAAAAPEKMPMKMAELKCRIVGMRQGGLEDEELLAVAECAARNWVYRDKEERDPERFMDAIEALPDGQIKTNLREGMLEQHEALRPQANRFVREVEALERDEKGMALGFDADALAAKYGAEREEDQGWGSGSHDPSEIWTFPDGSMASVGNPNQAAFHVSVMELNERMLSVEEKEQLADRLVAMADARSGGKKDFSWKKWEELPLKIQESVAELTGVPQEDRKKAALTMLDGDKRMAKLTRDVLDDMKGRGQGLEGNER